MTTLNPTHEPRHAPLIVSGSEPTLKPRTEAAVEPITDTKRALRALSQRSEEIYHAISVICHFRDDSNERRSGYDRRTGRLIDSDGDRRARNDRRLPLNERLLLLKQELHQILEHQEILHLTKALG